MSHQGLASCTRRVTVTREQVQDEWRACEDDVSHQEIACSSPRRVTVTPHASVRDEAARATGHLEPAAAESPAPAPGLGAQTATTWAKSASRGALSTLERIAEVDRYTLVVKRRDYPYAPRHRRIRETKSLTHRFALLLVPFKVDAFVIRLSTVES